MKVIKTILRIIKKIILWFLAIFFILAAIGALPHYAGFLGLLATICLVPINKWQKLLNKVFIRRLIKTIFVIVLCFVTIFVYPSVDSTEVSNESGVTTVSTTATADLETTSTTTASTTKSISTSATTSKQITKVTTTAIVTTTTQLTTKLTTIVTTTTSKVHTTTKKTTVKTTTKKTTTTTTAKKVSYVLNTDSKIFHKLTCKKLPTKNRKDVTMTREEMINSGYTPCKSCKP